MVRGNCQYPYQNSNGSALYCNLPEEILMMQGGRQACMSIKTIGYGVATGTSLEQNFMTIIGLEAACTVSNCTVADSKPLLLMQLVTPIQDW